MSAAGTPKLAQWRRAVRRQRWLIACTCTCPPALGVVALVARNGGSRAALVAALVVSALAAVAAWRYASRDDDAWLARRLDALAPKLEDSTALLWREADALTPLQRLQRTRLEARLADLDIDVRPPWPQRALLVSACVALALLTFAALWPAARGHVDAPRDTSAAADTAATHLLGAQLAITPPAYIGLLARIEAALDAKVAQDSRLAWKLRFDREPQSVHLAFHDGSRLDLHRDGADWIGERAIATSSLYRVELDGAAPLGDDLHRIDVVADRAPSIRIVAPDKTLSEYDGAQKTWPLEFEADDDYGIAKAELVVTHAQGDGENVKFDERTIALAGDARDGLRRQHYAHALDLAALGFASGDEVVARLVVTDNREPKPNATRSASLILRWPVAASKDSSGLEGIAQQTMPAYFRSQRQIIIDTEALLADKPTLDDAKLLARSDAIGVDQKILRLRYGQFLGEESEGHAEAAVDAGQAGADSQVGALAAAHEATEKPAQQSTKFGEAGNIEAEYGHVHDIAEASTLLDAQTRATLKAALDQMWQAELNLRQGQPAAALPFEQRALDLVKQAQQATRIYLSRVGLELPVPDEKRRLSGERKDVADRVGTLNAVADADAPLEHLWRTLGDGTPPDWDAATQALRTRDAAAPETLDVLAALDKARRDPACADCRAKLRDKLWPLLPTPPARVAPRVAPDAAGAAYLDALQTAQGGAR